MGHDAYGSGSAPGFGSAEALQGMPFGLGSVFAGKYRVDRVLGAGGMGVVVSAKNIRLEQRVAIKVMRPAAAESEEFILRFSREARATAHLRGEHVARVLDVGTLDGGLPFMVMEHLEGCDLSRLLRERGALEVSQAVDYMLQACEALAEAHRVGIVHRDLKPANLFLTRRADGSALVKVLDFGISKLSGDDDLGGDALTKTQAMMGSPHYMSPEQLRSPRGVDARADLWSLGAVLFRLLTNETPFVAESAAELCVAILVGSPRMVRELRPEVPPGLEAVIARCLSRQIADRYGTAVELAHALAPFGPGSAMDVADRAQRVAGARPLVAVSYAPPSPREATQALPGAVFPAHPSGATLTSSASSLSPPRRAAPLSEAAKALLVVAGFMFVLVASLFAAFLAKGGFGRPEVSGPPAATARAPAALPVEARPAPASTIGTPPTLAPVIELGDVPPSAAPDAAPRAPRVVSTVKTARPSPTAPPPPKGGGGSGGNELPDFGGRK